MFRRRSSGALPGSAWLVRCLVLAALLPAACSGGGGAAPPPPPVEPPVLPPRDLDPGSLVAMTRPLDDAERRHLLARTAFGGRPEELARLTELGLDAFVDETVLFERRELELRAEREIADQDHPTRDELVRYWLHVLCRTEQPFQEALALFWHQRLAVPQDHLAAGHLHLYLQHVRLLRWAGVTNLRDFLRATIRDPAILISLDAPSSTVAHPNENLAREFWERFSLGAGNGYTEDDIREAARALTGFRLGTDPVTGLVTVVFDPSLHDHGTMTIFGVRGSFGPDELVDLTLYHRDAERVLARALFEWLCYPDPPESVVGPLAAQLRLSAYELRPMLRTLLRSEAFFSARSRAHRRVKSPVEYLVGFIRATGLELPLPRLHARLEQLGQVPTAPPDVGGWPGGEAWISPGAMAVRGNAVVEAVSSRSHQRGLRFDLRTLLPQGTDATAAVDALAGRLGITIDAGERERYRAYLDTRAVLEGSSVVRLPDPFDPGNVEHLEERVRGLLYVLAQHPSYHLR
jgi:hypothetical protein